MQVGLTPESFFSLPDWAIIPAFEGAEARQREAWKQAGFTGYYAGLLPRVKRMPEIGEIFAMFDPKPDLTADDMRATLEALGGKTDGGE